MDQILRGEQRHEHRLQAVSPFVLPPPHLGPLILESLLIYLGVYI